jgi:L-fuconolactonase
LAWESIGDKLDRYKVKIMRIDSHQHFWRVSRNDYGWMEPSNPVLYRDYGPEDLKPALVKHRIDKTIVVQAASTMAETDFLLDVAKRHDFVGGVVGWLDMQSGDFDRLLAEYQKKPKFVGIRPMLQDIPEDDYIVKPAVIESLERTAESGAAFDFLTYTRHLPYVLRALDRVPDLRAVVDHISKPEIKAQKMEPWRSLIREVAAHENVYCKLSGMITEADHKNWKPEHLRPYIEHVVECFGPERVMFGSDWPVCLQAGTYDRVIEALYTILEPLLDEASKTAVFGANAARFYEIT